MADKSQESPKAFERRIDDIMSHGFLTLGLSLGSKLGLFDLMAGLNEPKTSQQIADAARFKERYVREWLNFMVVGEIIAKDVNGCYFLPHQHRQSLSGKHPANKLIHCWALPIVSHAEQNLCEVFALDGPRVTTVDLPGINDWRKRMLADSLDARIDELLGAPGIKQQLDAGVEVAELGCGPGQMLLAMAKRYSKSTFYGLEISDKAREMAEKSALDEGITNVKFINQDVCCMPDEWSNKFDYIYGKSVVHDLPFAIKCLRDCFRCLKRDGKLFVIEVNVHSDSNLNIGNPWAVFVNMMSLFSCLSSGFCEEGSDGLGAMWGQERAIEAFSKIGFSRVDKIDENKNYFSILCTK